MNKEKHTWLLVIIFITGAVLMMQSCSSPQEKTLVPVQTETARLETGKTLFYTRCASCHQVNQDLTGPALKGVEFRWTDKEKLYAFIRNSEEVIRTDKYARERWLQYNQTMMPPQPDLTNDTIRAVLDYINSVSDK